MNEETKVTRRRFLVWTGATVGAGVLTCGGLGVWATRPPEIEFVESSYGKEKNVKDKILVAYASRAGSTGEVAEAIGKVLAHQSSGNGGAMVDVRPAKDVTDVGSYRAVVVGSAVYMGQWMPEAVEFVKRHRDALGQMPVACFTVCVLMKDDVEQNRGMVSAYLNPEGSQGLQVQPVDVGLFAGRMDYSKLSFLYRTIAKAVDRTKGGGGERDLRDWEAIRAWADEVRPALLGV
jgi:menaquinone-dependent protoporphyrinogen oxidase